MNPIQWLRNGVNLARHWPSLITTTVRRLLARAHPSPVIILGNQKCGTTVIGALLGYVADDSVTLDIFHRIKRSPLPELLTGELPLADCIRDHRIYFSTRIIKEPNLSFFYRELRDYFPEGRIAWVQRDPRDNIRSILDRLRLPGNLDQLDEATFADLPTGWQIILDGTLFRSKGRNYIETLANRWNRAADIAFQNLGEIELVRYEDFMRDKIGTIEKLATALGLTASHDISDRLEIQYQPRGNRAVRWIDFFGEENLQLIESTCSRRMHDFGYKVSLAEGSAVPFREM